MNGARGRHSISDRQSLLPDGFLQTPPLVRPFAVRFSSENLIYGINLKYFRRKLVLLLRTMPSDDWRFLAIESIHWMTGSRKVIGERRSYRRRTEETSVLQWLTVGITLVALVGIPLGILGVGMSGLHSSFPTTMLALFAMLPAPFLGLGSLLVILGST
jgi:hypothetical protein